jgi:hypothetical protein
VHDACCPHTSLPHLLPHLQPTNCKNRSFVPGLSALQSAALTLGATSGAAPWQLLLNPAAAARAVGLAPGAALLPVFYGSGDGGATWQPVAFRDLPRAGGAAAAPAALPGALGLARPLLGEQLLAAGGGELADSLWLVRLADRLLEVSGSVAGGVEKGWL